MADQPEWITGEETVGDEADAAAAAEVIDLEPEEVEELLAEAEESDD